MDMQEEEGDACLTPAQATLMKRLAHTTQDDENIDSRLQQTSGMVEQHGRPPHAPEYETDDINHETDVVTQVAPPTNVELLSSSVSIIRTALDGRPVGDRLALLGAILTVSVSGITIERFLQLLGTGKSTNYQDFFTIIAGLPVPNSPRISNLHNGDQGGILWNMPYLDGEHVRRRNTQSPKSVSSLHSTLPDVLLRDPKHTPATDALEKLLAVCDEQLRLYNARSEPLASDDGEDRHSEIVSWLNTAMGPEGSKIFHKSVWIDYELMEAIRNCDPDVLREQSLQLQEIIKEYEENVMPLVQQALRNEPAQDEDNTVPRPQP